MRSFIVFASLLITSTWACSASAGPVLDRVKSEGVVHCGSVERPGLATVEGNHWVGLNVDVCRAISAAVLGSPDHVEFHEYETPKQFDAIASGDDEVFFLTGSEIKDHELAGKVLTGPTVFLESHAVMVPKNSKVQHVKDLADKSVCFMIASNVERSLANYFGRLNKDFIQIGYSEDGEMTDAYQVQRCTGLAYELTTLATVAADPGVKHLAHRILPEPLSVFPVMATTGTTDAQWSSIVAWTVHTLIAAERKETRWYDGGAKAMPVVAGDLGLDKDWQAHVVAAVGTYGDVYDRNVGKKSGLKLPRGLNANQMEGGLMLSPFLE